MRRDSQLDGEDRGLSLIAVVRETMVMIFETSDDDYGGMLIELINVTTSFIHLVMRMC